MEFVKLRKIEEHINQNLDIVKKECDSGPEEANKDELYDMTGFKEAVYLPELKEEPYCEDNSELNMYEITREVVNKEDEAPKIYESVFLESTTHEYAENIDLKNELCTEVQYFYCPECQVEYQEVCPKCPKLCYILHNSAAKRDSGRLQKNIPLNILEIRDKISRVGVFALQIIPKGVIFGPFEGLLLVQSTKGAMWKINDNKIATNKNENWMQCVNSAEDILYQNLVIFQYEDELYFRCIREIPVDEELLVYFSEECVINGNSTDEIYYRPPLEEGLGKVYACTFCCLGFKSDVYLIEHKIKCPHSQRYVKEITQCSGCNIFFDKEEYFEHHMIYCCGNNERKCALRVKTEEVIESLVTPDEELNPNFSNSNGNHSETLKTNNELSLKTHDSTHTTVVRSFECKICVKKYKRMRNLKFHIKDKHSQRDEKEYKCAHCKYQTNDKHELKRHLYRHIDLKSVEKFKCNKCQYETHRKTYFNNHLRRHANPKKYKCNYCEYRSDDKRNLENHLFRHGDPLLDKKLKCKKCEYQTNDNRCLEHHILTHADPTMEKKYKCGKCEYATHFKRNLTSHLGKHTDPSSNKRYKCDTCKFETRFKSSLNIHLRRHSDPILEKRYKCNKCEYKSYDNGNLKKHLVIHDNPRNRKERVLPRESFKCPKCEYQTYYKGTLKRHLLKHSDSTSEKNYKCDKCDYQANLKSCLKRHALKHADPTSDKKYRGDKCEYQTHFNRDLKRHLLMHGDSMVKNK